MQLNEVFLIIMIEVLLIWLQKNTFENKIKIIVSIEGGVLNTRHPSNALDIIV